MTDKTTTLEEIKNTCQKFVDARDWGQFHSPKNLSMTIATEAAELMEIFRWCETHASDHEAEKNRTKVEHEAADIFFGLMLLCNRCNIDLAKALQAKIKINHERYPVAKSKGKAIKYTDL